MAMREPLQLKELAPLEFPRTHAALREGIAAGLSPGFVAGLWQLKDRRHAHVAAVGNRRAIPSAEPMLPDTTFDLASVSKVFGTAALAATLVERKWIQWNAPLKCFLPEFPTDDVLLSHLLSHTAGLSWWEPYWQKLRERFGDPLWRAPIADRQREMRRLMCAAPREARPGERAVYSDPSFMLLGFALEEATSMPLDSAIRDLVWSQMGIEMGEGKGAFYRRIDNSPENARLDFVAATEKDSWRGGLLQGQVHDDNCWAMGGYAGHAGAFGRAQDVLQFAARLVMGHFSRETLGAMWTRVPQPSGCERTLGWDTPSGAEPSAGRFFSPRSVGHLGYTGTSIWIDPEASLAVTLLGTRVHPDRNEERIQAFRKFRPRFHDALREDLRAQY
jgi:CubicO group peptidase (beta-lactamase class C family)